MAVEAHRFFVPVGVVALATGPSGLDFSDAGETYFDTALGQLRTWDGIQWVGGATGPRGPAGPEGPEGPAGITEVSSETGNAAIIDASGNIYVPDEVIIANGPSEPIGDNLEIWVDPAGTGQVFDAYSRSEADAAFVNVIGDTMNGPLYLYGDPTGPLEAATKDYVDTHSGGGGTGGLDEATANGLYVNIIGDTMSGPLFLPADPTGPLEAPTKQYVDARIWYGSQAEYDAIVTKDPSILYCIGV